jgi:hypothetical protein
LGEEGVNYDSCFLPVGDECYGRCHRPTIGGSGGLPRTPGAETVALAVVDSRTVAEQREAAVSIGKSVCG